MVAEAEFFLAGVSLGDYGVSWRQCKIYSVNTVTSRHFARWAKVRTAVWLPKVLQVACGN